jgi:hypothetical protein
MLNEDDLKQKLSEAGLKIDTIEVQPRLPSGKRPDFLVQSGIDGRDITLVVELKERPHLSELRLAADRIRRYVGDNQVPMVAAHYLGPNRRALLREMGISYIDMSGNIYLRAPGILVEREGKPNRLSYQREGLNPYSDKASIILRILMEEPIRSWKIREIANAGGITPGWASRVADSLVKRGVVKYNQQDGITLLRGEDVLREWADFYDWHKNRVYYYYCHAYDSQELLNKIGKLDNNNVKFALGFQAGAYLVSPYSTFNQVHLLIDGSSFETVRREIENKMELEQRKDGANLILVLPYYKHSALFHARKIKNWWVVSDTQLYLDLNRYPLRGHEQAEKLLEKVIRPKFNKMKIKRGSK